MQNSVNTKLLYTNIFPQSGCLIFLLNLWQKALMLWKISTSQCLKKCGTIYNHTFVCAHNTGQNGPEKKKAM